MTTPVQTPIGQQTPEAAGRRAVWLALAAVAMTLLLPLAGVVLCMIALVTGIRAVGALRRAAKPSALAVTAVVVSTLSLLWSLLAIAGQIYFSQELAAYTECKIGAGTVASMEECVNLLERGLEQKMPFLKPGDLQFPFAP
ncbi:hypothetical protein C1I98_21480 [Spongiactinospora gelatinilytica]|uniref:DUF4190 domain-containing protein n=1 Tax=Spongiactinospora gelatinilytica TaxID=2666298 RepID=A0A2W2GUR9_9ACTN|nr:hypothetical protein [Spongiactinospora gelatinilytica]PZG41320.1 hypothetical protein C1I98_21480 [Spongiactinospora gelatinilytica]